MKRNSKYIILICSFILISSLWALNADFLESSRFLPEFELEAPAPQEPDTIPPRFPVSKTTTEEYEDLLKKSPADLKDPENIKTTIEYDIKTGAYIVRTKLGDMELGTPMTLTPEEYQDYSMQQSLQSYFREKNAEEFEKEVNKKFNITDMQFDLGPAERIFGKGGVRVKTQGSAQLSIGLKTNKTDNPSLPIRSRKQTSFNFDEDVQLNVQASVGSKVNFGITLQPNLFFMPMEDKNLVGDTQKNLFDGPYYKKISSFRTPSRTMAVGEYFSTGWDSDPTVVAWVKYVEMHEPSGLLLINARLAATHDGVAKNMLYIGGNASKFRLNPNRSAVATKELWGTKTNI